MKKNTKEPKSSMPSTQANLLTPNFIRLGNLKSIWNPNCLNVECFNNQECNLLNNVVTSFYLTWTQTFKNQSPEIKMFKKSINYSQGNMKRVEEKIKGISNNEFQASGSHLLRRFLLNPEIFLRKHSFLNMSWHERLICLVFLIKRHAFLAPPACFCSKSLLAFLRKKSQKRRHELIRFSLKKCVNLLMGKCLPEKILKKSAALQRRTFYPMLNESIPGTSSRNLLKSVFNEGGKDRKIQSQRLKSVQELVLKLQTNKITCSFFTSQRLQTIFYEIYQNYYPVRRLKVKHFIERFQGRNLFEVFKQCNDFLSNKRTKFFFNHEDIKAGYELIKELMH